MPLPQRSQSLALPAQATVDQPCDRADSARVPPMVPIPLGQRLKAAHPSNGVFDLNAPPREGLIVGDVLCWLRFAARLTAGCRPQPLWMQLGDAHIGQVTETPHTHGQRVVSTTRT